VVGSAPANFYDSWARLIARYWGKHIPGNPNVIVQNMPGAGSITAVNYVYGVAKADGLTVVLPNNSIYIEQTDRTPGAQFDLRKYHWLGSAAQESIMFYSGRIRRTKRRRISGPNNRQLRRLGNHELGLHRGEILELRWARRSTRFRVIRAAATLIWRWKKAKSSAARIRWRRISAASRSIPPNLHTESCFRRARISLGVRIEAAEGQSLLVQELNGSRRNATPAYARGRRSRLFPPPDQRRCRPDNPKPS